MAKRPTANAVRPQDAAAADGKASGRVRRALAAVSTGNRQADRYCIALLAGYGLFKILMDLTYTTAASTIENSYILINNLSFSIATSVFIMLTSAALAVACWRAPARRLDVPALVSLPVLSCVNPLAATGLFSLMPPSWEVVVLAAVYGVAAIAANTAWLVPFASLAPRRCLTLLALGMLAGSVGTALVGELPAPARPWALFALGAASTALYALHMQQRKDLEHSPKGPWPVRVDVLAPAAKPAHTSGRARIAEAASYLGSPFSVYATIGLILGLITAFQVSGDQGMAGSSSLRSLATIAAYVLAICFGLFARTTPSIRKTFGRSCPVIALILVAMPFVDTVGGAVFTSVLTAFNAFASVSMLFLLLEYARAARLPVGAAVAAVTFCSRLILLVGLVCGAVLGMQSGIDATVRSLIVAIVSIYLIMLVLVTFARSRRTPLRSDSVSLGSADGSPTPEGPAAATGSPASAQPVARAAWEVSPDEAPAWSPRPDGIPATGPEAAGEPSAPTETYAQCADALGDRYGLTSREQEVLLLLARGRSAAYVADELGLATSTVRSYTKSLYAKLDVHSKQELIDLFSAGRSEDRDA